MFAIPLMIAACVAWVLALSCSGASPKRKLLLESDHDAIFEACQELLENRGGYRVDPSWSGDTQEELRLRYPDPTDPRIPLAIRSLGPSYIVVDEEFVILEMAGGFHHLGLKALSQERCDRSGGDPGISAPDVRKLRQCLWFYEE